MTRFYLTAAARSPSFAVTPSSRWDQTSGAVTPAMLPTKSGANAAAAVAETSTSPTFDVLVAQWVSTPILRRGTLGTSYRFCIGRFESNTAADMISSYTIYVVKSDGSLRGTMESRTLSGEWPTAVTAHDTAVRTGLTTVDCEPGDYLVMEFGYQAQNAVATSYDGTVRYGGTDATDLTHGDTTTNATSRSPWVDLDVGAMFVTGQDFLPGELTDASVAVEIAWGADLTDSDGSGWTWTDVTDDVRQQDGINVQLGRNDEASTSTPASLSLVLDNSTASYSLGGQSPNWPNVRRNVPVRVRVEPSLGAGFTTVFQGYANGFTPGWDSAKGTIPVATLSASGVLRRLAQGSDPLRSALFRYLTFVEVPQEYWPLEEDKTSSQGASFVGGNPATFTSIDSGGVLYGKVGWGADTDNPATSRAVQVAAGGGISCPIRAGLITGTYKAISWSMRYPGSSGAFLRILSTATGSSAAFNATFYTDGSVELYEGATLRMDWSMGDAIDYDNVWHHYLLVLNGTALTMYVDGVSVDTGTASTTYVPNAVELASAPNPGGVEDPISVGHVAVWTTAPSTASLATAAAAHVGETAQARLVRLCGQEALDLSVSGTATVTMGPQRPLSLLALLRECEAADQGILYDGVGPGLRYVCRSVRENAAVGLTVLATQLAPPFAPADDDQRTRNRVTANPVTGGAQTHEDATGPMGTDVIGIYDSSVDVNPSDPDEAIHYAGWAVHLGTVEGYRYPSVTLNMRSAAVLATSVLAAVPSTRVLLQNVGDVMAAMEDEDVALLVEGVAMTMSPYGWMVTLRCSPYDPWVIATIASETGDTDADLWRLDTAGSTLSAAAVQGATSISITTASGALWTLTADDFPFYLDVGGVKVRATACADGTSPQVVTVDALPVARSSGAVVKLWAPPALGL